ncbi:BED zinc finger [Onchocerca flexuosa]|uniref:BED zinc finger n=1 Tax=Onchocerca flexuosa TaxID=387005 RepID=A0A238BXH7_9BILA|nr:BED zinc finger [Onchocerca flexuosa]
MSTSSVISGNSAKSTGCHKIVISPPIVPSQYNAKNAGRKKTNPFWALYWIYQNCLAIQHRCLITNGLLKKASYTRRNHYLCILIKVWNFFVDLKTKGLSGVRCRYCEWITNDRSPTTLKFHLKRKHDTGIGGIWNIVEERIGINQPQGRSRLVVNNRNGETAAFVIPVDTEVRPESDREQQCYPEVLKFEIVDRE